MLGRAVTAQAVVAARHTAGRVRSPGGLLRRMVELHQEGRRRLRARPSVVAGAPG